MLELNFDTDNDAFADGRGPGECARLLRTIAGKIEAAPDTSGGPIHDVNGNYIGHWALDLIAETD